MDYSPLLEQSFTPEIEAWLKSIIPDELNRRLSPDVHGTIPEWLEAFHKLPKITPSGIDLNQDAIKIGDGEDFEGRNTTKFRDTLMRFHPWRKGPWNYFGTEIETEWHSDWKWNRLRPHLSSLEEQRVLDIGSGNGYYGWRMVGDGARSVIGIDPTLYSVMQFWVSQYYIQDPRNYVLPLGIEDLPSSLTGFDTVFSLGVLYHRKSPIEHLEHIRSLLRPGGEMVLETLVIEGKEGEILFPQDRYAQMRNVWFLPSVSELEKWARRVGFKNVRCVDLNRTSIEEQRSTDWMQFHSLEVFLDPNDRSKTVEGYPAPLRAVVIAES